MKTSHDPRHLKRRKMVQNLFSYSFQNDFDANSQGFINSTKDIDKLLKQLSKIDTTIEKIAPEFPIEKINKVDLAILRLGVFELEISKEEPPKVILDEAIELAKEFGGDSSPAFINGALGRLVEKE